MSLVPFFKIVLISLNLLYILTFPGVADAMGPEPTESVHYPPAQNKKTSIEILHKDLIKYRILLNESSTFQSLNHFTSTNREFSKFKKELIQKLLQNLSQNLNRIHALNPEEIGQLINNQGALTRALLRQIHHTELSWIDSNLKRDELSEEERNKIFLGALAAKILIDISLLRHPAYELALDTADQVAKESFQDIPPNSLVERGLSGQMDISQTMRKQAEEALKDNPSLFLQLHILTDLTYDFCINDGDRTDSENELVLLEMNTQGTAETALRPMISAAVNQTVKDRPGEIGKTSCILATLLTLHWINKYHATPFQEAYFLGKTYKFKKDPINRDDFINYIREILDGKYPPSTPLRSHPILQEFEQFIEDLRTILRSA